MSGRMTTSVLAKLTLAAGLTLLVPAAGQADAPGYEFMMFPDRMALVVDPQSMAGAGKTPKGIISEQSAAALVAGQQPVSGANIVLLYHGKVYIVPDTRLPNGQMASEMVRSSAESASK